MWQRGEIWNIVRCLAFAACALWLWPAIAAPAGAAQDRSWDGEAGTPVAAEQLALNPLVLELETNSIILAVLCFAVGFAACLLVVRSLLPSLVHVQCVEIVREYLQHTRRESDVRVVVLDRETREPLRQPRRASAPAAETTVTRTRELPPHRVSSATGSASAVIPCATDSASAVIPCATGSASASDVTASRELPPHLRIDRPTTSASPARVGSSEPADDTAPDSMLSQIYEQNLHLRDQLREQGRSVRP